MPNTVNKLPQSGQTSIFQWTEYSKRTITGWSWVGMDVFIKKIDGKDDTNKSGW